jgi:MYXO-CTERM domain-containing protein
MKKINSSSWSSALVLAAGLFAATFPAAGQSILINIYEGNPAAVQFVATTNFPTPDDSSQYNSFGVDILNYFTAPASTGGTVAGTLIPAGTSAAYNGWFPDNLHAATSVDLNLYVTANPQLQIFTNRSRAFTGTATIDLSSFLAQLPGTGATGNIYSGDARSAGAWLGKWIVVPEPPVEAQVAMGAIVLAGLALVRRSRRAAARR